MTISNSNKKKEKKEEVDFTQFTPEDIAKRFLETPPKPKKKEKKKS